MRAAALLLVAPLALLASRAEARGGGGCHERSEIVGQQRCSTFGFHWDVTGWTSFVVAFGPSMMRLPVSGMSFDATVSGKRGDGPAIKVSGRGLGTWTSLGASLRAAWFIPRAFYVGVEGYAGGTVVPTGESVPILGYGSGPVVELPAFAVHPFGADVRSLGSIVGVSLPAWRFDFSLEVFSGFRAVSPNFDWTSPAAANKAGGGCWSLACPSVDAGWAVAPRVEPRAGVAFRVQPWVTLRALGGIDPLTRGAWSATALLEIHSRPYDGFHQRRRAGEPE